MVKRVAKDFRIIDGIVAGAFLVESIYQLPALFAFDSWYSANWWGQVGGVLFKFIVSVLLIRFGAGMCFPALAYSLFTIVISVWAAIIKVGGQHIFMMGYLPVAGIHLVLSVLLIFRIVYWLRKG